MAKGQYHLGKSGPAICRADPSKLGGRSCRYEAQGHFSSLSEAEIAYAAEFSGSVPGPVSRIESLNRPAMGSYTEVQIGAIRDYINGHSWEINGRLRSGSELRGRSKRSAEILDGLIEGSTPLKAPAMVMRSLATEQGRFFGIPGSGIYSDEAFLSCSTSRDYIEGTLKSGVDDYSDSTSDTVLSIELPAGARVLAISLEDEDYAKEAEVILPRNSKLEILEDSGFGNGVRRLRARMILEENHG